MTGRKLKSSERVLLIVLALVVIFTAFVVFPLRKHLKAIEFATVRRDMAKAELESIKKPKDPAPDIDRLSGELAQVREDRRLLEDRLAALGGDLHSKEIPGLLEELNHSIANLAIECGLWIRKNIPLRLSENQELMRRKRLGQWTSSVRANSAASIQLLPDDVKDRPFRKLEMIATYPGFRKFIEKFCKLSSRLVVTGFSIETDPREASMPGPPLLKIELIWVLI